MPLYKGFSTHEFQRNKTFSVTDVELVKLNLLNHIFTKRGERVMMPSFGTSIPEMVFEPLDDETVEIIQEDLEQVFNYDPRVELIELKVIPLFDQNLIFVSAKLFYIELNMTDTLELNIEFAS